jgi:pimeloyl-ACP methyl ester carboxylesterase
MKHTANWDGRVWSATAGAVLAVSGAVLPATAGGTSTDPGGDASAAGGYELRTSGVPRVEEGDCAALIPSSDRVRCLTLVVPESRDVTADSDRLVRIPVVIIAARDLSDRYPDPVLWIGDAAGDGFVAQRTIFFTNESLALNEHRDVVTLDLRGTGLAEPLLTCPEVTDLNIGAFAADIDETTPEGRALRVDAVQQCHDRLVGEGVDLSAYAADDAARDLEDLRIALGVEQWNIVAGEYGSKLAQILARDLPDGVRTVVVNSTPVPLQADWFADLASNAAQAWDALVAACTADAGCAQAFPDLGERLETLVADLTANPRSDDAVPLFDGRRVPFRMSASRLLAYVRFYGRAEFFSAVPMSIAGPRGAENMFLQTFDADDPGTWMSQASDLYFQPAWGLWELVPNYAAIENGSFALGAQLSSLCRDEAPFASAEGPAAAGTAALFGPYLGHHGDLEACDAWAVEPAPASANEPVHSDVPFLVLAGDFDTVSSPAWADAFADGLTNAHIVHFHGVGAQPTGGAPSTAQTCARQLRDAFLAEPLGPLDESCAATSRGVPFLLS